MLLPGAIVIVDVQRYRALTADIQTALPKLPRGASAPLRL